MHGMIRTGPQRCGLDLLVVFLALAAGAEGVAEAGPLDAATRRCLAKRLAAREQKPLALGPRDAFAVMDPHTGRLLWLGHPGILAKQSHQPGSIFKLITAYVALGRPEIDPRAVYDCRGWKRDEGHRSAPVRCWLKPGHGPVNLSKALALSCNLYFARLGVRLSAGSVLEGARAFGLGRSTGSDLPGEVAGTLPVQPVREQAARLATGQGRNVTVNPLQMLSAVAAVANGGMLLTPRRDDPGGPRTPQRGVLDDARALRFLRDAMEEASTFGTGQAQKLRSLGLAGKTGTAAWARGWKTHAWYVGFAPCRAPRLALCVFVYEGMGSREAATLARRVMEAVYQEMGNCGLEVHR